MEVCEGEGGGVMVSFTSAIGYGPHTCTLYNVHVS